MLSERKALDLDALEKVARAAAKAGAVWTGKIVPQHYPECDDADLPYDVTDEGGRLVVSVPEAYSDRRRPYEADGEFIATFDPATVLALLSQARLLEEARTELKRLERDYQELHDTHDKRTRERDEALKAIEGLARLGQLVTNAVDPGGHFHVSALKDAVVAAEARAEAAERLWAWLAEHQALELSFAWAEEPMLGEEGEWVVHRVHGGINDREWTLVGSGPTPLVAVLAAREALSHLQREKGGERPGPASSVSGAAAGCQPRRPARTDVEPGCDLTDLPAPGEIRVINGERCRFIERELEGDKWEILGPADGAVSQEGRG